MPKIIGQTPPVRRVLTGLHSLDRAFNVDQKPLGLPVGTGIELFGPTHTGKSTFAHSLASILATKEERGWALCDLEGFDRDFIFNIAEFQGMGDDLIVQICDGTTAKNTTLANAADELLMDELVDYLNTGHFAVGVLDSIGAISPISETAGEIGESNMGRRGLVMAQFTRKMGKVFRHPNAPTILAINHYYPKLGGTKEWITPGGEVKNYLFPIRIRLQQLKVDRFDDGSYILRGFVVKNRWGGGRDENQFEVFIQSGYGIHRGLTAVLDSLTLGVATGEGRVKLGDKSWWRKELREAWADPKVFQPFHDALDKFTEEQLSNGH